MDWEALAAAAEVVGAVAVVVSLIYVAVQIRQANQLSRANTFQNVNNQWSNIWAMLANSAELSELHRKIKLGEYLDLEDFERYSAFLMSYLAWLEDLYIQQRSGLFAVELAGKDAIEFMAPQFEPFLNSPQVREWLAGAGKAGFSPDYYSTLITTLSENRAR